jgi:hypothetical protein
MSKLIFEMNRIILKSTKGLQGWAVLNRGENERAWMDGIEKTSTRLRLTSKEEIFAMDRIAEQLGINCKSYESRPYWDFLHEVHARLQGVREVVIRNR